MTPDDLDMHVIYDVSHNIAKIEEHMVDGKPKTLLVHRKVSVAFISKNQDRIQEISSRAKKKQNKVRKCLRYLQRYLKEVFD